MVLMLKTTDHAAVLMQNNHSRWRLLLEAADAFQRNIRRVRGLRRVGTLKLSELLRENSVPRLGTCEAR